MSLIPSKLPWGDNATPASWTEFIWPDWVPTTVRRQIMDFWDDFGRGPGAYAEGCSSPYNNVPDFGERVVLGSYKSDPFQGRYVHAWNNMGRLVLDDGSYRVVSTCGYRPGRTLEEARLDNFQSMLPDARKQIDQTVRKLRTLIGLGGPDLLYDLVDPLVSVLELVPSEICCEPDSDDAQLS